MANSHCVYKHTSPSGKVYIGVTSGKPEKRWNHGHGYAYNAHFWRAIVKYGWDNISHEILEYGLSREKAYALEREYIEYYKSTNPRYGYNITDGGCGGMCGIKDSEETRKRKSVSARVGWEKRRERYGESGGNPIKNGLSRHRSKVGHKKTPVVQYSLDGEYCRQWSSMCAIERELGIPTGKISECCHGKRGSCKGYIWKFLEVLE